MVKQKATNVTMYSVESIEDRDGIARQEVVTHHLPWEKGNSKIESLIDNGYTYERPRIGEVVNESQVRTTQKKRVDALKKAREAKATKNK